MLYALCALRSMSCASIHALFPYLSFGVILVIPHSALRIESFWYLPQAKRSSRERSDRSSSPARDGALLKARRAGPPPFRIPPLTLLKRSDRCLSFSALRTQHSGLFLGAESRSSSAALLERSVQRFANFHGASMVGSAITRPDPRQ